VSAVRKYVKRLHGEAVEVLSQYWVEMQRMMDNVGEMHSADAPVFGLSDMVSLWASVTVN